VFTGLILLRTCSKFLSNERNCADEEKLPSGVKREQFELIKPLLKSARRKTAPRKVHLYEVFCAVLYLLRTGCQWRALPSGFPKWRTVHSYWAIWSEPREGGNLLEQALKKQVGAAREKQERSACSAFLIVDAQSVKNTDTATFKGYDAGKKGASQNSEFKVR